MNIPITLRSPNVSWLAPTWENKFYCYRCRTPLCSSIPCYIYSILYNKYPINFGWSSLLKLGKQLYKVNLSKTGQIKNILSLSIHVKVTSVHADMTHCSLSFFWQRASMQLSVDSGLELTGHRSVGRILYFSELTLLQ